MNNVKSVMKLRDSLKLYYNLTMEGHKKGLSVEEISSFINTDLGNTKGIGDPLTVKQNFIRSIILENNIIK